tara:strand:- start:3089 stop:3787 length:699 start_codon:yes stop_codon:yes gene_type:complete
MRYSLVIPCFNEEGSLLKILNRTKDIFIKNKIELIIVNNGSTDKTHSILKNNINKYPHATYIKLDNNIGYGGGILTGLKECKGKIIGWTHADLQTDPIDCIKAFNNFKNNNKIDKIFIKGNRKDRPFKDQFFTLGMSIFETILFRRLIFDINAQPTIFPKYFYETWINPPNDFSIDLYAYYLAIRNNYKVKRINVRFLKRVSGKSSWNRGFISRLKFILRTVKFSFKLLLKS